MVHKLRPVDGARDFHPEDMQLRNWLAGKIQGVLERYGFEAWDAPLLEYRTLYHGGSNGSLVEEQALIFSASNGSALVLRPELTPSLARVVASRQDLRILPLRWYAFGPFWRSELPQPGRGSEFRQWNIDVIGIQSSLADAEIVILAIDILRNLGLSSDEVVLRVASRQLLKATLKQMGAPEARYPDLLRIIDKRAKLTFDDWRHEALDIGLSSAQVDDLQAYLSDSNLWKKDEALRSVFGAVDGLGWRDYLAYDPRVIRAASYYTGLVFEAFDRSGKFPAILGGGRYDHLVSDVGGHLLPGLGFAIGDVAIVEVLKYTNKLPRFNSRPAQVLVAVPTVGCTAQAHRLAHRLRASGIRVEISPEISSPNEQLRYGARRKVRYVVATANHGGEAEQIQITNIQTGASLACGFKEAVGYLAGG